MEKLDTVGADALLVGYQAHERCDRSGYPRRRHRMFIHPLARLVAAADVYAAVTCPRPHRAGLSPHGAMKLLLREAQAERLDRDVVRAFLHALSMFPVGSYVRLSDGTAGRVLRSNPDNPLRPVIVPLQSDGEEADDVVDLGRQKQLQIQAAISADEATASPRAA
jgi:HD-GYP domain-containing protein (c-di-GMP phosphodiesterase class II)